MATQDTSKEDEVLDKDDAVETNKEDETTSDVEEDSNEETEDSDDSEDSEEDADAETDEEDEPEFKKRFTQLKGDSYEEYVPELEKAYANAVTEIARFKQADKEKQSKLDAVLTAAAKDTEFAKKLDELMGGDAENVTVDPALLDARARMEEQMDKDYKGFADAHPEFVSDPILQEEVLSLVKEFGTASRKQGKIMSMKEALTKAWVFLGKDDSQEQVVTKAKEVAANPKTSNKAKKQAKKSDFTDEQLRMAKKWGLSPDQLAAAKSS